MRCKKDSPILELNVKPSPTNIIMDTIYPGSYFPAYPKSYWRYIDTNGDTSALYTSDTYVKDRYINDFVNHTIDSAYVPICNGIPIYGYKEHRSDYFYYVSGTFPKFMSEVDDIGVSWCFKAFSSSHSYYYRKVLAIDTTINIGGVNYFPTIVIEESTGTIPYPIYRRYYTKNIGLIRMEYIVIGLSSFTVNNTVNLQSYFINH